MEKTQRREDKESSMTSTTSVLKKCLEKYGAVNDIICPRVGILVIQLELNSRNTSDSTQKWRYIQTSADTSKLSEMPKPAIRNQGV